ncbi:MAG: transglycosylase SLT domain-containing protein [Deltaproteobacteria bacterium]
MKQTILFIFYLLTIILSPSVTLAGEEKQGDRLSYALKLFQQADYNKAIDELKIISAETEENNTTLEASYLIGVAYKAIGNLDDAVGWLQRSSKYEPIADYAVFSLGETYLNAENYQAALDTFLTIKSRFPDSRWGEDADFKASVALFQLGRYIESHLSLDRFIKAYPRSSLIPLARIKIAECNEKIWDPNEAYNQYKAIWVNYPASPESRTAWDRMRQISSSELATSLSIPLSMPSLDERYSRVCNLFSNSSYREGINELTTIMKEVEEKDDATKPKWFAESMLKLGDAYYQVREDNKALAALKKLSSTYSLPKMLAEGAFLSAKTLQRLGQRAEAAAAFDKLIKDFPGGEFAAKGMYRWADMAEGDSNTAWARSLYHNLYTELPDNTLADDSLWKEGWLNYLEKDYKAAYLIFNKLLTGYPNSEFTDTATYWSARTAEKLGMLDKGMAHYTDVITNFPLSYYAAISRGRVFPSETPVRKAKSLSYEPHDERTIPDRYVSLHLNKGKEMMALGLREDASVELSMAESRCTDKVILLEIARLMTRIGAYNKAQRLVVNRFQEFLEDDMGLPDKEIWTFAFPAGFSEDVRINADKNSLNPFLIHAIIKEESAYRADVVSRAGAVGLMQLMPSTGYKISREAGSNDYNTPSLFRSEVNISLGSRYLKKLVEGSKGKIPLAIASYNAGPNVVSSWVSRYGTEEMDEFIEKIPYPETRNYVKKVLRSYAVYERLYGPSSSAVYSKEPVLKKDVVALELSELQQYK